MWFPALFHLCDFTSEFVGKMRYFWSLAVKALKTSRIRVFATILEPHLQTGVAGCRFSVLGVEYSPWRRISGHDHTYFMIPHVPKTISSFPLILFQSCSLSIDPSEYQNALCFVRLQNHFSMNHNAVIVKKVFIICHLWRVPFTK